MSAISKGAPAESKAEIVTRYRTDNRWMKKPVVNSSKIPTTILGRNLIEDSRAERC